MSQPSRYGVGGDGVLGTEAAEIYGYSISAPVVEEGAKGLVLFGLFWLNRHEFNGVVDGVVYAGLVGLGFAMTENVLYYGRGAAEEGVVGAVGTFIARGLLSPFAHPIFTAMMIFGLGFALITPNLVALIGFVLLVVTIEMQVRVVEEPHLLATHGNAYRDYLAGVGRFIPGVGRG